MLGRTGGRITMRRVAGKSSRTPNRIDIWTVRHPRVFLALAGISAACSWFILYAKPGSDGPLTWLALFLSGLAGVLAVWPFMIRKQIGTRGEHLGDE